METTYTAKLKALYIVAGLYTKAYTKSFSGVVNDDTKVKGFLVAYGDLLRSDDQEGYINSSREIDLLD